MEDKYYLAIETKPRNYFPLNLVDLNLSKINPTKLEELDSITLKFSREEIIQAIKKANLLEVESSMSLVVIYYEKKYIRKVEALTKETTLYFDMWKFLQDNFSNKELLNRIYNFLNHKIEDAILTHLKNPIDLKDYLNTITKMSYFDQRKLYFYLYEL